MKIRKSEKSIAVQLEHFSLNTFIFKKSIKRIPVASSLIDDVIPDVSNLFFLLITEPDFFNHIIFSLVPVLLNGRLQKGDLSTLLIDRFIILTGNFVRSYEVFIFRRDWFFLNLMILI